MKFCSKEKKPFSFQTFSKPQQKITTQTYCIIAHKKFVFKLLMKLSACVIKVFAVRLTFS
ncbi:MAG: hypothetical protein RLY40_644 [Pseudomonadota bacterium]|jgi:hypothetical protein